MEEYKGHASSESGVGDYSDHLHAEVLDDLKVSEHGYKFRVLDGVVMPPYITPERYQLSRSIETRPTDICYVGFPNSGSTWLSYILLLLVNKGDIPADKTLGECINWVANSWMYPKSEAELDALPPHRIFRSHMPYHMAFGGEPTTNSCKYIYLARNPKDVVASYYQFERGKKWAGQYAGPWSHWLDMFLRGRVQRGHWFSHVLGWWKYKDTSNILFLKYEDLIENLERELWKIAAFLRLPLSPDTLNRIVEKTAFQNMKSDAFSNYHEVREFRGIFRKGVVGSWKEEFTVAQSERFDKIYEDRMRGSGLDFTFS